MNLRAHFPFFSTHPDHVYLDSAATTQKPQAMLDCWLKLHRDGIANVHRASYARAQQLTTAFEDVRQLVARWINAPDRNHIIWTKNCTEAINLVAFGWAQQHLRAGDRVLISALEHHANIVPWQQLVQRIGIELIIIPIHEDGSLDETTFTNLVDARVKLLAITAQSNVLGTCLPLQRLIQAAKAVGARVLVDAAQAVAHQIINVQTLDCDFLCFSAHKLYGPSGLGILYAKAERLAEMTPLLFGGEMVQNVRWEKSVFQEAPLKFEAGTPPIAEVIAFGASLNFLQEQQWTKNFQEQKRLQQLAEYYLDQFDEITRYSRAPENAGVVTFSVNNQHSLDVAHFFDAKNIAVRVGQLCAMPLVQTLQVQGVIRLSLGVYSNEDDIHRFGKTLTDFFEHASHPNTFTVTNTPTAIPLYEQIKSTRAWDKRQRLLLQQAQSHQKWTEAEREQAIRVNGCESATWLRVTTHSDGCVFDIDSDARIVIGLGAVVLSLVNGRSAADIAAMPLENLLQEAGLQSQLSPSRTNGLLAIIKTIRECVVTQP